MRHEGQERAAQLRDAMSAIRQAELMVVRSSRRVEREAIAFAIGLALLTFVMGSAAALAAWWLAVLAIVPVGMFAWHLCSKVGYLRESVVQLATETAKTDRDRLLREVNADAN